MIQMLRKRLDRKDEGFTLIELMVVVLIIAILLAIAIPTFLGARSRAQNRSAESNLRNALTAEKTGFTDNSSYEAATAVQSIEPSLSFVTVANSALTSGSNMVQATVVGVNNNAVCLIAKSGSGGFYGVLDVANVDANFVGTGTFYGSGTATLACPTTTTAVGGTTGGVGTAWGNTTALGGW